jgi:type IV secretory pathway TrbD component
MGGIHQMSKVYQSLARPKLKRGGQWQFTSSIGIFAIFMVFATILSHRFEPVIFAALFYWPALWLARQAAKHDPQWLEVYFRSFTHSFWHPIREPHGYAFTRDSKAPEILAKPPQWIK